MTTARPNTERPRRTQPSNVVEADGEPFNPQSLLPEDGPENGPEDPFAAEPAPEGRTESAEPPAMPASGPESPEPANGQAGGYEPTGYAAIDIMATDPELLMEAISQNLGGSGLNINDLHKVTVPSAGMRVWSIETEEGNQTVQSIEGIIIHRTSPRAWWAKPLEETGGNSQPDCSSPDGVYGSPGPANAAKIKTEAGTTEVECVTCPFNQFGSARNGRGKACHEKDLLYVLQTNRVLPIIIQVPPTSLRNIKNYMVKLVDSKDFRPYWQVVTKFELEMVKGETVPYSAIVPTRAAIIPKTHVPQLKQFREKLLPALARFGSQFHQELMQEPEALPESPQEPAGGAGAGPEEETEE